ncbi:MAG: radical SAM protein [Thermodesulfovibrionales bacterium]|jgi:putative pyruvate formate lyase activating enzyme
MVAYLFLPFEALQKRVVEAEAVLKECILCPRRCGANRTAGEKGFCGSLDRPFVASWGPHFGEERPLVGRFGSGTIFFGRCNLSCVFCQNWTISQKDEGGEISFEKLSKIMIELQETGCHNINLVTPTHQLPMILRSLMMAKELGLQLPVVYNCGGYESPEVLALLDGVVDIYMPDFKYADAAMALRYSRAEDYPEAAKAALREMHRQVGDLTVDERGIAVRGLLVRHLVLPENIAGTGETVRFIAREISTNTYLNIMDQYYPCHEAREYPALARRITSGEYRAAIDLALKAGIKRIVGVTV